MLGGCANLLPRGDSEQPSGFDSFEAAAQAFDKVVAYRTTVEQLRTLGFDLQSSANVTLIPYPRAGNNLEAISETFKCPCAANTQVRGRLFMQCSGQVWNVSKFR